MNKAARQKKTKTRVCIVLWVGLSKARLNSINCNDYHVSDRVWVARFPSGQSCALSVLLWELPLRVALKIFTGTRRSKQPLTSQVTVSLTLPFC